MKLFDRIEIVQTLRRGAWYMASTSNESGVITADGNTPNEALENLQAAVRELRMPTQEELSEPYGPRTFCEWSYQNRKRLE